MKTKIIWTMLSLIMVTGGYSAEGPKIVRQHFRVIEPGGRVSQRTDLVFLGPVEGMVTLWQSASGERYVFRSSQVYQQSTLNFGIRNLETKEELAGRFLLPYSGGTLAEAKAQARSLPESAYEGVPFTITVGHFRATAPIEHWHEASSSQRAELRRHVPEPFAHSMKRNTTIAAASGSPAARMVCDFLLDAVSEGAVCHPDKSITVEQTNPDCTFDAKFGYPCQE